MPAGSVQYIIECQSSGTSGFSTAPCVTADGVRYKPVMVQAYVIDPAAASYIDAVSTPYNYAQGGALWAFGFAFTLGLWLVAKNIGFVLNAVKRF